MPPEYKEHTYYAPVVINVQEFRSMSLFEKLSDLRDNDLLTDNEFKKLQIRLIRK